MTDVASNTPSNGKNHIKPDSKIYQYTVRILLVVMSAEGFYLLYSAQWLSAFLIFVIILILISPLIFRKKLRVVIPIEFHIAAILFTLAALYLGEVQQFYNRLWWWDIALHTTAGLLMGIVGFLLVYILNASDRVNLYLEPGFIALFAYLFAISIGTFWEIFEFAIDSLAGTNMQKPMFGDLSGLTDTMWDMVVNAIGALIISAMGWWYLKTGERFFVSDWIRSFIDHNPDLFKK